MIRAVVGAGGKTGLIRKMAADFRREGKKVFVTTSTHMFIEEDTLLSDDADVIIRELDEKGYALAGRKDGKKIRELSRETYERVCRYADEVLMEADGSRHLPLKFPRADEPVIYDNVEEIIIVCGLHALGKQAKAVVHRLEQAKDVFEIADDTIITPEHIQNFVRKGYVKKLKEAYPEKNIKIEANHDGSLYQRAVAALLKADMDVSLIREEWFQSQPRLIICGGGHVAYEVAKMASYLDFYIKVLDDREEFANRERFPEVDEVICDSFENLENYLEPNAYYIVVTRGHRDDHECVKKILQNSYAYLGMIGSKLKVAKTFENMRSEGIAEEKIQTIHAPIGLPIKAVTPAEIAVSILAQIIQEKNGKQISSVSRELLETQKQGTLCIIIEKHGSSPRGVGSMMFVGEDTVIDTIGGGAVEYEVLQEAKKQPAAMIKEYQLESSAELGMICGGSNKVLFLPV